MILHGMKELKCVYAGIERLRMFESQITEKVWLAGAPSEIASLLKEIGDRKYRLKAHIQKRQPTSE